MAKELEAPVSATTPAGSRRELAWKVGRVAGSFTFGLAFGAVLVVVSFGLAMTQPLFILPVLVIFGMVLSVMRWPAMVGAASLLVLISNEEDLYIPLWVPVLLGVTWTACRGAWIVFRGLRD